ncbi:hypothetical protein AB3X52_09665 [Nocardioides sp. DS6]|uniref:Immunity repressor n=1 Tax=Nocardioides eburneus TaxID=3231482 RepID=A0ABV3SY64_9ACTN
MGKSKIQNEREVLRWFEEGRTYEWMVRTYRQKYNIETTISMWGNFRRRRGLDRRITWDDELIPWKIKPEHNHDYPILMLRKEARRRAGFPLPDGVDGEVDAWLRGMQRDGTVLHYDPTAKKGWCYVPRRSGVDTDIIRKPTRPTGKRKST